VPGGLPRATSAAAPALLAAIAIANAAAGAEPGHAIRAGAGERLYREGLLSSGQPVEAVVQGDVAVTGVQLSCATCHGRSGMGTFEGTKVAPPVTPAYLDGERRLRSRPRPPYDAHTLARVIREGVDSAGNHLAPLMPRYRIGDEDMADLLAYLRHLSVRPSPGASMEEIHFATVVAPGVSPASRETMLRVIQAFFRSKNAASRDREKWHVKDWPEYYGKWRLHVWDLRGAPSTWRAQLEDRYREQPVFALVSGIGEGEWRPVHRFCEARQIPCLMPNLDTPPDPGPDWYSLYFSGGTLLEARVIAVDLAKHPGRGPVVQAFRAGGPGAEAARALAGALRAAGREPPRDLALPRGEPLPAGLAGPLARAGRDAAAVLWLEPGDLAVLGKDAAALAGHRIYVSSTLLGGDLGGVSSLGAAEVLAAHPYALPAEEKQRSGRVSSWLTAQRIAPAGGRERRVADQTFFALTVLSEGIDHLKKNFFRDYLLELVDHFSGISSWSTFYPRLTFGPGQRHLSKGCYLVSLRQTGARPEWIVP
jgi:hypothetical protein